MPSKPSIALAEAERPRDRRTESGLCKQGHVARAQARDSGVGPYVRRHGPLRRRRRAELTLPYDRSPKIEPEIVFKLGAADRVGRPDAAAVLQTRGLAGDRLRDIDCPYPDWQFKPADFVAAFGLHLALVVGQPLPLEPELLATLVIPGWRISSSAYQETGSS